jgi:hypothetical protein
MDKAGLHLTSMVEEGGAAKSLPRGRDAFLDQGKGESPVHLLICCGQIRVTLHIGDAKGP